eukprot:5746749-Heterocapsa_arctica.AAC.1
MDMTIDTFYVEPVVSATWSVTPTVIIPLVIIGLYQFSDESCQSGGMLCGVRLHPGHRMVGAGDVYIGCGGDSIDSEFADSDEGCPDPRRERRAAQGEREASTTPRRERHAARGEREASPAGRLIYRKAQSTTGPERYDAPRGQPKCS